MAVAGTALLTIIGGVLLGGGRVPKPSPSPSRESAEPLRIEFPLAGHLTEGTRYPMIREEGGPSSVAIPAAGWVSDGSRRIEKDGAQLSFWPTTPDGTFVDPCAGVMGPPQQTAADLVAAVASIPGIVLETGPEDVEVGGYPAKRVVFSVPAKIACRASDFGLWYGEAGRSYPSGYGDRIRVWIVDFDIVRHDGPFAWIDAQTPANVGPDIENEIEQIVDSIEFGALVPPAADLPPGVYGAGFGPGISFELAEAGWRGSEAHQHGAMGELTKGSAGQRDGAVLRFLNDPILRPYVDPCEHILGPTLRGVHDERRVAEALSAIPGLDVTGRTREHFIVGTSLEHLTLRIPSDIGCDPGDFYLWNDADAGIRTATATESTIELWIFYPDNRPYVWPLVIVEAETYRDAAPELSAEIHAIVQSISHGG